MEAWKDYYVLGNLEVTIVTSYRNDYISILHYDTSFCSDAAEI